MVWADNLPETPFLPEMKHTNLQQWVTDLLRALRDAFLTTRHRINVGFFENRGDPSSWDYNETGSKTVLNTDGTWRDLDLSSIVPKGTHAVLLQVHLKDDVAGSSIFFRKNGNTNEYNYGVVTTQVANIYCDQEVAVPCDTGAVIEYLGSNVAFVSIIICVKGWWK